MPQSILEGIACVLSEKVIPHSGVVYCQGDEVEDLFLIYKGGVKVGSLYEFRQHPWPMGYSSTLGGTQTCTQLCCAMKAQLGTRNTHLTWEEPHGLLLLPSLHCVQGLLIWLGLLHQNAETTVTFHRTMSPSLMLQAELQRGYAWPSASSPHFTAPTHSRFVICSTFEQMPADVL